MAYIYTAFIQYKDLFGRFANPTVTPTVTAYKSSDGTTISGATLTNIATGLYKASVSHTVLEPVLFRVIPAVADKPSFEDVAVMASEVRFDVDDNFAAIKGTGWSTETLKAIKEYVDDLEGRLTAARAGYLDKLNVAGILANTNNADTFKADISGLATASALSATDGKVDAIKAKTDNLPPNPAPANEYDTELANLRADVNAIDPLIEILIDTGTQQFTTADLLKIIAAKLVGKASGAETTTVTYRNIEDTVDIIVETVDEHGNRHEVILS